MNYCVGFIFNKGLNKVLLVRKNKGPINMAGKLNGIGGKLENDESGMCAMIRECREETGLELNDWIFFCKLIVNERDNVYFYYTVTDEIYKYKQLEDEPLQIYFLEDHPAASVQYPLYTEKNRIANLNWLIPMAINHYNKLDSAISFSIVENYKKL